MSSFFSGDTMFRYTLVVIAFYFVCCAMAFGETAPADRGKGATDTRQHPESRDRATSKTTGEDVRDPRDIRRSVMDRADSIDAPAEQGQLSYSAASPMQVPKKEPKTLKKHDRVAIVVREESQFNSQGTTDLKKNADIDAKVDSYVKLNLGKFAVEGKNPAITPEIKAELQRDFKGEGTIDESLLEDGPERDLYSGFVHVRDIARANPYGPALAAVATLRPQVDIFFDKVLVNAPDANVRRNRHTLLHNLLTEFSTIADFSEIVTQ